MIFKQIYDLVCIGNYTKDTIISPQGVKYVDGGAINYAAHAAHRLVKKVAVVTRLAEEDRRVVDKFIQDGIDCYASYTPQSTTMRLEYPNSDPDFRYLSVASTAGSITAKDLEGLQTRAALIGTSFRGETGLDVMQTLSEKEIMLGADMQGYVRVLRGQSLKYETWDEMEKALPYLDVLKSDAVEARELTGEEDIHTAAKVFASLGAKEILFTHRDGLLLYAKGEFYSAGFYPKSLDGRSGRGDTCFGAYMAKRLSAEPPEAMIWSAAITTLKMERLGPFDRSMEEVEQLLHSKYNHRLFERSS
jgi:sugar/nucleoside kinase (ribokinase family)